MFKIYQYIIGITPIIFAIHILMGGPESVPLILASSFLIIMCITDVFSNKITNKTNVALLLTGIAYHLISTGASGLIIALLGGMLGLLLLLPGYLLRMLGAGDVKALAALGALTGPGAIIQIFLYTSIIGGCIAVIYYILHNASLNRVRGMIHTLNIFVLTKSLKILKPAPANMKFPYAGAIALGYFAYNHYGNIL